MAINNWTEFEFNFLKENYLKMTDEEIGKVLGRSTNGVNTKRKRLKLKRKEPQQKKEIKEKQNLYTEESAKQQLVNIFNELKRPPTKEDGKIHKMKPARDWYVDKYGSIENACVHYGLIEKPLSIEERMNISIVELRKVAEQLGRVPFYYEYEKMKTKGYTKYPLQNHFNMPYSQICNKYLNDFKEIIPDGYKKCSICGKLKQLFEFGDHFSDASNLRCSCKLCDYFKRNTLMVPIGWTEEECVIIIDNILNEKITYINDLCNILDRKLEDIILLLDKDIKISNKPLNVKYNCSFCGKEESKPLSVYLKNKEYFCSSECYWNFKRECEPKGEDHPSYNRVEKKCDNCGEDIKVIPWGIENHHHNFCSQKCYWEFRSKYYIGEKHSQFGLKKTTEQKRKMRIATVKSYENGTFKRRTKPQIKVDEMLDDLNMVFKNEYNCKYYAIDNYLSEYNLMIEVNGDYFHSNPLKFTELNTMQIKGIIRDKRKRTYIKRYKEIDVLYLWESDINDKLEMCKELILEYVNNKGILSNYNSFNYSLVEEKLVLNKDIVVPYIDWDSVSINQLKK